MKKLLISGLLSCTLLLSGFIGQLHKAEAASPGETAANLALNFIGVPYKWGGISPSGFDCSGLVNYTYKKAGISLPRTAEQLFHKGKTVSKSNLHEGDLVFFSTYKAGASHVGIYLNNNRFVHASTSGVRVDSLSTRYWVKTYLGSKRVDNSPSGWVQSSGNWYFYENGAKKIGWVQDSGDWYYLGTDGVMKTNWVSWKGNWYYLDQFGAMGTGWISSAGKWYYFNKDGTMAHDTTIDGYKLGSDGARTK